MLFKLILTIFLISINLNSYAGSNEFIFPKGNLIILAPPVINKDYILLELGFVVEKSIESWGYKYNAYATAALFQDSQDLGHNHAGALGFKGGVFLPTQPWIPLFLTGSFGYAKTTVQKNPFLGRDESSVARKAMVLLEAGALYRIDKYFIRFVHQRSNVKYFKRHNILMFGVNY